MTLAFCICLAKTLTLKWRKFLGLIPAFVKVTGKKLIRAAFWPTPILNRLKTLTNAPKEYLPYPTYIYIFLVPQYCLPNKRFQVSKLESGPGYLRILKMHHSNLVSGKPLKTLFRFLLISPYPVTSLVQSQGYSPKN